MRPLEAWEIQEALRHMHSGSAPGQDGLTVSFYKEFADLIVPHLITLFEELYDTGSFPPTLREAMIVTIPKPGKSPEECSSYRPLSLLNVDVKLYAKVLANRLAPLVPSLEGSEQAGFVPGRNLTYNIRTFFGALQHINPKVKAAAAFLDVEKAFDSVEWPFMRAVL